jgi:ATP-dependent exoDNAse (exonuclease V) alpha subunit
LTNGINIDVIRMRWNMDQSMRSARFDQYPLRLAYAVTIHKSQGSTMDAAYVDIACAREPGQAYVAISRVKTLAGLHSKQWPNGIWISEEAMKFYQQ